MYRCYGGERDALFPLFLFLSGVSLMLATSALLERMADLLGADTVTLAAPTTFVEIHLSQTPFTPTPTVVPGDITPATFDGYAPLSAGSAATQVFVDPATGDVMLQMVEPLGGWTFQTSGVTNLPQTIYGWILTDAAGAVAHGSQLLDDPVTLDGVGQGFSVPRVGFRLPNGSLT